MNNNQMQWTPEALLVRNIMEKLKNYEVQCLNDYDLLIPITNRDMSKFRKMGYRNGVAVTPIGVDQGDYIPDFSSFNTTDSLDIIVHGVG